MRHHFHAPDLHQIPFPLKFREEGSCGALQAEGEEGGVGKVDDGAQSVDYNKEPFNDCEIDGFQLREECRREEQQHEGNVGIAYCRGAEMESTYEEVKAGCRCQ